MGSAAPTLNHNQYKNKHTSPQSKATRVWTIYLFDMKSRQGKKKTANPLRRQNIQYLPTKHTAATFKNDGIIICKTQVQTGRGWQRLKIAPTMSLYDSFRYLVMVIFFFSDYINLTIHYNLEIFTNRVMNYNHISNIADASIS